MSTTQDLVDAAAGAIAGGSRRALAREWGLNERTPSEWADPDRRKQPHPDFVAAMRWAVDDPASWQAHRDAVQALRARGLSLLVAWITADPDGWRRRVAATP